MVNDVAVKLVLKIFGVDIALTPHLREDLLGRGQLVVLEREGVRIGCGAEGDDGTEDKGSKVGEHCFSLNGWSHYTPCF